MARIRDKKAHVPKKNGTYAWEKWHACAIKIGTLEAHVPARNWNVGTRARKSGTFNITEINA